MIVIFVVLLLLIVLTPYKSHSMWVLVETEIEIDIDLIRVDPDIDAPFHEQDEGQYGFYDENQVFHLVVDFTQPEFIVLPYTAKQVKWEPGPLDKPI